MITEDFMRQAAAAGAECHLVDDASTLASRIASLLQDAGVSDTPGRFAVWAAGPVENLGPEAEALAAVAGLRLDVTREAAAQSLIGINAADWGVAQTGTLISDSSEAALRLVSTLPEIHIALLRTSRIVADMATALARVDPRNSRFLAAITGPSRTADIERVLTIGVHGPKRLIIVIVQDGKAGDRLI